MVVDAGGGTIDITVHHSGEDGIVELHPPSGGSWGSSFINNQFVALLEELLGVEHISKCKDLEDWYEVMDAFEVGILLCFAIAI